MCIYVPEFTHFSMYCLLMYLILTSRYEVHPKMVNFMASMETSTWTDEAKYVLSLNYYVMGNAIYIEISCISCILMCIY